MYKMSVDELLALLNEGRQKPFVREDIEQEEIKVSLLKKIDEVFKKGINFYLDPRTPQETIESSIFFRKERFNSELNLESKKIVTHFEDFKNNFTAIAKLSEVQLSRKVPVFAVNQNPRQVANAIRQSLYPEFKVEKRDFLKLFIGQLGSADILVSEFVETCVETGQG